jgi:hypothetical protein
MDERDQKQLRKVTVDLDGSRVSCGRKDDKHVGSMVHNV